MNSNVQNKDGITKAIENQHYEGIKDLLTKNKIGKFFSAEHIELAIEKYREVKDGQENKVMELFFNDKFLKEGFGESSISTAIDAENTQSLNFFLARIPKSFTDKHISDVIKNGNDQMLKDLLNNSTTKKLFEAKHVDQIVEAGKNSMLNTVLDHKSSSRLISSEHISKVIEKGSTEMFTSLLREPKVETFKREHISEAITHNQPDILEKLLLKNKHATAEMADINHAFQAINEYKEPESSEKKTVFSVLLDKKSELFSKKYQDVKGKMTDLIGHTIQEKKNGALEIILEKIPKSVTGKHVEIAIGSNNEQALSLILEKKPELITKEHLSQAIESRHPASVAAIVDDKPELLTKKHVLAAANTGNVELMDKVFTEAFKREGDKKIHLDINKSGIRDQALFELAEYARNNENQVDPNQNQVSFNPFEVMSNLMQEGANSKTSHKDDRGIKTSVLKILNEIAEKYQDNEGFKECLEISNGQKERFLFKSMWDSLTGKKQEKTGYQSVVSDDEVGEAEGLDWHDSINEIEKEKQVDEIGTKGDLELDKSDSLSLSSNESDYESDMGDQSSLSEIEPDYSTIEDPNQDNQSQISLKGQAPPTSLGNTANKDILDGVPEQTEELYATVNKPAKNPDTISNAASVTKTKQPSVASTANHNIKEVSGIPVAPPLPEGGFSKNNMDKQHAPVPPAPPLPGAINPISNLDSSQKTEEVSGERNALLSAIQGFSSVANLKKVDKSNQGQAENSSNEERKTSDIRSNLMDQIKEGAKLKPVSENEKNTPSSSRRNSTLSDALNKRRTSLEGGQEELGEVGEVVAKSEDRNANGLIQSRPNFDAEQKDSTATNIPIPPPPPLPGAVGSKLPTNTKQLSVTPIAANLTSVTDPSTSEVGRKGMAKQPDDLTKKDPKSHAFLEQIKGLKSPESAKKLLKPANKNSNEKTETTDSRSDLMSAIRGGKTLKPVSENEKNSPSSSRRSSVSSTSSEGSWLNSLSDAIKQMGSLKGEQQEEQEENDHEWDIDAPSLKEAATEIGENLIDGYESGYESDSSKSVDTEQKGTFAEKIKQEENQPQERKGGVVGG